MRLALSIILLLLVPSTFIITGERNTEMAQKQPTPSGLEVPLYFTGDTFTPILSQGNQSESKDAPGRLWGARWLVMLVGTWSLTITQPLSINGKFFGGFWMKSEQGANNAFLQIQMEKNGNSIGTFVTERKQLTSQPIQIFLRDEQLSADFNTGDTFSARVYYGAGSNLIIGPSNSAEFLYGSMTHDSRLVITAETIRINMSQTPTVEGDKVKITATILDSLGIDPKTWYYNISITGPATARRQHITTPNIESKENGTSVTWDWLYRKDNAGAGDYTISVTAGYNENRSITNSSTYYLPLVKSDRRKDILPGLEFILIAIAIAAIIAVFIFILWRKKHRMNLIH